MTKIRRTTLKDILHNASRGTVEIAVIDLETNGLGPDRSVLSCCMISFTLQVNPFCLCETTRIQRYYYPTEPMDSQSASIHGFSFDELTRLRAGADYPTYFRSDSEILGRIARADFIVCHNVNFESRYMPPVPSVSYFCTMKSNVRALRLPRRNGGWKYPTLHETAQHYRIPHDDSLLHRCEYDAELTAKILEQMLIMQSPRMPGAYCADSRMNAL